MKSRLAFTLVELLVTVAIIAILASIALPNFLEAQTRAKVAAVAADLRTLATALESYAVDHGHYPPASGVADRYEPFGPFATPVSRRLATLTTPVAYISSVPRDRFPPSDGWATPDVSVLDTYDYVDAQAVQTRGSGISSGGEWRIASAGPDRYQAYGGRPVSDISANMMGVNYDPSNGSASPGDLVRVGPLSTSPVDPQDLTNPNRPGILRAPVYKEQWH